MTEKVEYQKPGIGKKIVYLVLMLVPILILLQMSAGAFGLSKALGLFKQLELDDKSNEIWVFVSKTLFSRIDIPSEYWVSFHSNVNASQINYLVETYPEIVEMGSIKGDKFESLYTNISSPEVRKAIAEMAPIVNDTAKVINTPSNLKPYSTYEHKIATLDIDNKDYIFILSPSDEETYLIVNDLAYMKFHFEDIFKWGRQRNSFLFDEFFDYYPGTYTAEIKMYNDAGEDFFTFGKPSGQAWSENHDRELPYYQCRMTVQLFTRNEADIRFAGFAKRVPRGLIISFVVGVVMIIMLGHMSTRLHGFSLRKE
jgi:hypothetical protein